MSSSPSFGLTRVACRIGPESLLATMLVATQLAGCGGNSSQPAPAAAPAKPAVAAAPTLTPANQPTAAEQLVQTAGSIARSALSFGNDGTPSGDTVPPGESARFVVVKDRMQAGSVWSVDPTPSGNSADRFAYVSLPASTDSSRFAVIAEDVNEGEGGAAGSAVLPRGFSAVPGSGYGPDRWPWRVRCEQDGALMALVPAGGFIQGKNGAAPNAGPEHGAFVDAFYMDVYEVTYDRYEKFRESSRAAKRPIAEPTRKPEDRREPVTGVTWGDVRLYAAWAGRELPTEAEWEKAARGAEGFDFPWGNGPHVWHRPRESGQRDRVGSFKGDVSPFGICDMAGNAREWCSDFYQEKYYTQLIRESGATPHNPTGPRSSSGGNERVVKGGDPEWRVWARDGVSLSDRPSDVGFRCVLRLKSPDKKR